MAIGVVYATLAAVGFAYNEATGVEDWPLKHDQVGYWAYLPALLTEGNLSFESFTGPRWERFVEGGFAGFDRLESTGRRQNVYTPGVALLQAPFFAVGHVLALATGAPRDGFSWPYRLLGCLGGAFYAVAGLVIVLFTLRRKFPEWVAIATVVALGLGTNLLYYGTIEPLMSHAYSFAAFAVVTWATLAWAESGKGGHALALGGALGVITLIRPTSAVLALLPLLYLVTRNQELGLRWSLTDDRRRIVLHLFAVVAAAALLAFPLPAYWRWVSGSWIHNPHGGGTFYFSDPAIPSVLWSYRKGWLVYTPLMALSIPGLFLVGRWARGLTLPLALFAAVNLYVVASWWSWWYGGGFGMRALIESSAPLALALAATLAWFGASARRRRATWALIALFASLNVFQSYQYVMTYIRWDGMTAQTYWAVFLRPYVPEAELAEIREHLDVEPPRLPRSPPPASTPR